MLYDEFMFLFFSNSNYVERIIIYGPGKKNYYEDSSTPTCEKITDSSPVSSHSLNQAPRQSDSFSTSSNSSNDIDSDDSVLDKDYVPDEEEETDDCVGDSIPTNQSTYLEKSVTSQGNAPILVSPAKKGLKMKKRPDT